MRSRYVVVIVGGGQEAIKPFRGNLIKIAGPQNPKDIGKAYEM